MLREVLLWIDKTFNIFIEQWLYLAAMLVCFYLVGKFIINVVKLVKKILEKKANRKPTPPSTPINPNVGNK